MGETSEFVLALAEDLSAVAETDVDPSIERALLRLGRLVGADRAYLFLLSADGATVSNTHEWCAVGVAPAAAMLQHVPRERFPWAFGVLSGRDELVVPLVSEAPASPEREEWTREGIESLFCAPLVVHNRIVGFLGCDWVGRADPLLEETRHAVRIARALVAGAVSRRAAFARLTRRREADELLLRISTRLLAVRAEALKPALQRALVELVGYLGLESGLVAEVGADGRIQVLQQVRSPPLPPAIPGRYEALAPVDTAALRSELRAGRSLVVPSLELVPPPLEPIVRLLRVEGLTSLACVPIPAPDGPQSFLGVAGARGPRTFAEDELSLLQLTAQAIGGLLGRLAADRNEAALQAQLRQTQKLEVIGQLAGGVAHDVNNVLLAITLAAELARLNLERNPARARSAIDELLRAAERASGLTRQLLTFSRSQPVRVAAVDPDQHVAELLAMLRRLVRASIRMEFTPGAEGARIAADPSQLSQVLLNLCVNASDAMPDGGVLQLRTRRATLGADPTRPPWLAPGEVVVLEVEDSGVGIPAELHERVFEPFFTTKAAGKGTGLGLATVWGIARQHGAWVRLQSAPGRGSIFELWWPLGVAGAQVGPAVGPALGARRGGGETILIAEDDPLVRASLAELLEGAGYVVRAAADGVEALELFRRHGAALAILDAIMPGASGLQTFRKLEALQPALPVLFTSGYASTVFPDGFFDDGTHTLLAKPYAAAELLAAVGAKLPKAG